MNHKHDEGLVFFADLARFSTLVRGMDLDQFADLLSAYAEIIYRCTTKAGGAGCIRFR